MRRVLEAEILDSLAPHDPAALHNRRDLRLTNAVMGNHRWLARAARRALRPGEIALEIGAGTGELGLRLNNAGRPADGLDLWPRPAAWPAQRQWHQADLLTFDRYEDYRAIAGNLIFHQFNDAELAALGGKFLRSARVVIACEPARRRAFQALFAVFAPLLGANHVSRHDGHVSIAAGFRGDELPRALGLNAQEWDLRYSTTLLGAYRMVAVRRQ